jgi:hypothetical protein
MTTKRRSPAAILPGRLTTGVVVAVDPLVGVGVDPWITGKPTR